MKNLLFGLIATVMFTAHTSAKEVINNITTPTEKEIVKVKVTVHFEWGRKSKDCQGFGICSFDVIIESDEGKFTAISDNQGVLTIEFNEKGLENLKSYFGTNTMIIEENYMLTEAVCKQLELKAGYTIKAGKYTVKSMGKGLYSVKL